MLSFKVLYPFMRGISTLDSVDLVVEPLAHVVLLEFYSSVLVGDHADWTDSVRGGGAEHFEKSSFVMGVEDFMDRNVSLN